LKFGIISVFVGDEGLLGELGAGGVLVVGAEPADVALGFFVGALTIQVDEALENALFGQVGGPSVGIGHGAFEDVGVVGGVGRGGFGVWEFEQVAEFGEEEGGVGAFAGAGVFPASDKGINIRLRRPLCHFADGRNFYRDGKLFWGRGEARRQRAAWDRVISRRGAGAQRLGRHYLTTDGH